MRGRMWMAAGAALVIFTAGCSHRAPTERDLINVDAALPAALPVQPLEWRVITSTIDREHHTMATLFGNDAAVQSARSTAGTVTYPAGSTLAMVTWTQKDDGHWFGARIPQRFVSMELVTVAAGTDGKAAASYQRFGASGQLASRPDQDAARKQAILTERPSVMP
jgi:Cytochrome P460